VNAPYAGPTPLDDEQHVFGRDAEIEELHWRVTADRIIVLYSASGAGKTSLLMAKNGLLAQLRERFFVLPAIRINGNKNDDPVTATLQQLAPAFGPAHPGETLGAYFDRIEIPECQPPKRLLIVIDQFEEIFSMHASSEKQREFFQQLGVVLAREQSPVWAIFSMREEYFSWLDTYRELIPTRLNNTFRLNLLTIAQAVAAIKGPAEALGITFPKEEDEDAATRLAAELSKVRVRLASGEVVILPGDRIEPVQLQVICLDLWRRLSERKTAIEQIRIADVAEFDPAKALQEYCDSALAKAAGDSSRGAVLRDWIDRRLLTPSGLRLPGTVDPADPKDPTDHELRALEEIHLIRRQTREDGAWYELSHDSLAIPVRRSIERWRLIYLAPWQTMARAWELGGRHVRYFATLTRQQLRQIPLRSSGAAFAETEIKFLDAYAIYRQQLAKSRLFLAIVAALAVTLCILYIDKIKKEATLVAERNVTALQAGVLAILSGNPSVGLGARAAVTGTQLQKDNPGAVAFNFRSLLSNYLNQNRNIVSVDAEGDGVSTMILADAEYRVVVAIGEDRHAVDGNNLQRKENGWSIDPQLLKQKHPGGIRTAVLLSRGRLATGGDDGGIQIWNLRTRQPEGALLISTASPHAALMRSAVRAMAVSGDMLYAGHEQKVVVAWNVADPSHDGTTEPVWTSRSQARVSALTPWTDGKGVAFSDISGEEHIRLVSTLEGAPRSTELIASPKEGNYRGAFYSIAISPDGRIVAAGSRAGKIHVWDIAAQRHLLRIDAHDQAVAQLKFLDDGELLSIGWDGRIKRWRLSADPAIQARGQTLLEFRRQLVSIAVVPLGREAYVSSGKGDILKISLVPDTLSFGRALRKTGPFATLSERDGVTTLIGTTGDGIAALRLNDGATANLPANSLSLPGIVGMARAETARSTFIARGNQIQLVHDDRLEQPPVAVLENIYGAIQSVHSNDKGTLLIVRTDRSTQVWAVPRPGALAVECQRGAQLPLSFPSGSTRLVAMRPASSDFITVGIRAQYWSVAPDSTGCPAISEQQETFANTRAEIQAAAFEPDGKILWAGDFIGQIYSVEVDITASKLGVLQSEAINPPSAIAASANRTIAVGDAQGGLYVFQPGSKFPVRLAQEFHTSGITSLDLSDDGSRLVSSSNEGTVIWDLNIDRWIARACSLANHRSFDKIESMTFFDRVSDKPIACASPQ